MAPVTGSATAPLRIYDRDSLVRIKESMEGLFDTRGRYKQAFPPPFIIDPDSPEYLLLCRAQKSAGNRGKEARVPESRSSEDALQHAWALPSSATENA
ncbi:unnamed protein product [Arctogadus glacialis]